MNKKILNKAELDQFLWDHRGNGCTAVKSPLKDCDGLTYNEAWVDNVTGVRIEIIYDDPDPHQ